MKNVYYGDVYLFQSQDGGQISIKNGQPLMDAGLETASYISLFAEDSWINDIIPDSRKNERMNSRMESIKKRKLTNNTRLDAEVIVKEAHQWMIDEKIIDRIEVSSSIPTINMLLLEINLIKNNINIGNFKYQINWENQINNPISSEEKNVC